MFICKICKSEVDSSMAVCPDCGANMQGGYSVVCPKCDTENEGGDRFCRSCGSNLPAMAMPVCADCGASGVIGAKFCVKCGGRMLAPASDIDVRDLSEKARMLDAYKSTLDRRSEVIEEQARERASQLLQYRNCLDSVPRQDAVKLHYVASALREYAAFAADPFAGMDDETVAAQSFVCPVCGHISPADSDHCTACGRDRRRTFELIKKGLVTPTGRAIRGPKYVPQEIASPTVAAAPEFHFDAPKSAEEKTIRRHGAPAAAKPQFPFAGFEEGATFTMPQIIQPITFVPYVTQDKSLADANASANGVNGNENM